MTDLAVLLALAALPAVGNMLGGLAADASRISERGLNLALHAAAGVILAIVTVEIAPRTLADASTVAAGLAFGAGGLAYLGLQSAVERLTDGLAGTWMVYVAVAIDLFTDGLMIGAGGAISHDLAMLLVLGQLLADMPEGFAAVASFKRGGVGRGRRLLLMASFVLPVLLSTALAYGLLSGQSGAAKALALAFTGGMLLFAAVEGVMVEAHEAASDTRSSVPAMIAGFVAFVLLASGLQGSS